jgi:tellurite resistance protein
VPRVETVADSVKTAAAIATAVADGELTPMEAAELSKVLDAYGGNRGLGRPLARLACAPSKDDYESLSK